MTLHLTKPEDAEKQDEGTIVSAGYGGWDGDNETFRLVITFERPPDFTFGDIKLARPFVVIRHDKFRSLLQSERKARGGSNG